MGGEGFEGGDQLLGRDDRRIDQFQPGIAQQEARLGKWNAKAVDVEMAEDIDVAIEILRLEAEDDNVGLKGASDLLPAQEGLVDAVTADAEVQGLGADAGLPFSANSN